MKTLRMLIEEAISVISMRYFRLRVLFKAALVGSLSIIIREGGGAII